MPLSPSNDGRAGSRPGSKTGGPSGGERGLPGPPCTGLLPASVPASSPAPLPPPCATHYCLLAAPLPSSQAFYLLPALASACHSPAPPGLLRSHPCVAFLRLSTRFIPSPALLGSLSPPTPCPANTLHATGLLRSLNRLIAPVLSDSQQSAQSAPGFASSSPFRLQPCLNPIPGFPSNPRTAKHCPCKKGLRQLGRSG